MLKVVSKKLEVTKRKVSKKWSKYRTIKAKVMSRKRLTLTEKKQILASERDLTRQNISKTYQDYQAVKYGLVHKSPYEGFRLSKRIQTKKTNQKIFKANKNFNTDKLDTIIPKILKGSNVKGVLIVFSVESEETGQKQYISNYVTADLLERIEGSVYDYVVQRFQAGNTKDYHLKFIYLRVIYDK